MGFTKIATLMGVSVLFISLIGVLHMRGPAVQLQGEAELAAPTPNRIMTEKRTPVEPVDSRSVSQGSTTSSLPPLVFPPCVPKKERIQVERQFALWAGVEDGEPKGVEIECMPFEAYTNVILLQKKRATIAQHVDSKPATFIHFQGRKNLHIGLETQQEVQHIIGNATIPSNDAATEVWWKSYVKPNYLNRLKIQNYKIPRICWEAKANCRWRWLLPPPPPIPRRDPKKKNYMSTVDGKQKSPQQAVPSPSPSPDSHDAEPVTHSFKYGILLPEVSCLSNLWHAFEEDILPLYDMMVRLGWHKHPEEVVVLFENTEKHGWGTWNAGCQSRNEYPYGTGPDSWSGLMLRQILNVKDEADAERRIIFYDEHAKWHLRQNWDRNRLVIDELVIGSSSLCFPFAGSIPRGKLAARPDMAHTALC